MSSFTFVSLILRRKLSTFSALMWTANTTQVTRPATWGSFVLPYQLMCRVLYRQVSIYNYIYLACSRTRQSSCLVRLHKSELRHRDNETCSVIGARLKTSISRSFTADFSSHYCWARGFFAHRLSRLLPSPWTWFMLFVAVFVPAFCSRARYLQSVQRTCRDRDRIYVCKILIYDE